jgi:predicted XRE-type DNA-binding protein
MKLIEWMTENGLDQVQAEDRLGIDQTTISRLLAGKSCSSATMTKVLDATDGKVTPNDLMGVSAD